MLTVDGPDQARQKNPFRRALSREAVNRRLGPAIEAVADGLINAFASDGEADLRGAFASRLPIRVILTVFGMPLEHEGQMRGWYDSFEQALANFTGDEAVAEAGRRNAADFRGLIRSEIEAVRLRPEGGLLSELVHAPTHERLTDEEIAANASIIFFGAISTVEALILNTLWALAVHPREWSRARSEPERLAAAIEETLRWTGPVQSATRHAAGDIDFKGVEIVAGETVNCILAAANRDPTVFTAPDRFDIDRANNAVHLAFGAGPHFCLGSHLARLEGAISISRLLERLPDLRVDLERSTPPTGYEFRQPSRLSATWAA